jgi:hypothetical protein
MRNYVKKQSKFLINERLNIENVCKTSNKIKSEYFDEEDDKTDSKSKLNNLLAKLERNLLKRKRPQFSVKEKYSLD